MPIQLQGATEIEHRLHMLLLEAIGGGRASEHYFQSACCINRQLLEQLPIVVSDNAASLRSISAGCDDIVSPRAVHNLG